jgi:hypothetical protein
MTSADRNDLMPAQEKLEWVTPKISLMRGRGTLMGAGKEKPQSFESNPVYGPS